MSPRVSRPLLVLSAAPLATLAAAILSTPADAQAGPQGGVVRYCSPGSNGATIHATGNGAMRSGEAQLTLEARDVPSGRMGLFVYGIPSPENPFGHGTLCIVGHHGVFRLPAVQVEADQTTVVQEVDLYSPANPGGTIEAGSTWGFQFLFRDGGSYDLTDAVRITFDTPVRLAPVLPLAQGEQSLHPAAETPGILVIDELAEWNGFWSLHAGDTLQPIPYIDFTAQTVVVVFAGLHSTGGYAVTVSGAQLSISSLYVTSVLSSPGPFCPVTEALTRPYQLVTVPRVDGMSLAQWTQSVQVGAPCN